MFEDFFRELGKHLKYITTTSGHKIYRCPFCGDSSNTNKGHLYVATDKPVFRCAKCGESGHFSKLINLFNLDNIVLPKTKISGNKYSNTPVSNIIKYTLDEDTENYLESRLGKVTIDPDEANIINNDELNNIWTGSSKYTSDRVIPKHSVNFLTYFKKKVVVRLYNEDDLKYFGRYDTIQLSEGSDVYILNNKRIFSEYFKHRTIVIAEGIFDILNTYYNLNMFPKDAIYTAALNAHIGKAYEIASSVAISFNPNIIVLADNDKKDIDYLKCLPKSLWNSTVIYRNTLGKDFGEKEVKGEISYGRANQR
jgi:uncharacterized Zn finger protein